MIITSGACADADINIFIDKKGKGRIFDQKNPIRSTGHYSIDFGSENEPSQANALAKDIFKTLTKIEDLPAYINECGSDVVVSKEYYLKLRKNNIKIFSYFSAESGDTYGFVPELNQVIHLISYTVC